jgi:hypothetical protein
MFASLGRLLLLIGLAFVVLGGGLLLLDRLGIHRVPGTVVWRRGGLTVIAPVGVMIVGSLLLTLIFNLIFRGR